MWLNGGKKAYVVLTHKVLGSVLSLEGVCGNSSPHHCSRGMVDKICNQLIDYMTPCFLQTMKYNIQMNYARKKDKSNLQSSSSLSQDSQISVHAMLHSPHLAGMEQEVTFWSKALHQIQEITDLWLSAQQKVFGMLCVMFMYNTIWSLYGELKKKNECWKKLIAARYFILSWVQNAIMRALCYGCRKAIPDILVMLKFYLLGQITVDIAHAQL